jgi:hypothetical protein
VSIKKGNLDNYNKPEKKRAPPLSADPRIDYPEIWEELQKNGYRAPYMGMDGEQHYELVDVNAEPCPSSQQKPFCMLLRDCRKLAYVEVSIEDKRLTRYGICEARACFNHWKECGLNA